MSIEAMKQALEALDSKYIVNCGAWVVQRTNAMTALRQAIEQAEKQEPFGYFQLDLRMDAWVQNRDNKKGVPFYTAPPKREWVGLTDEELIASADAIPYQMDCIIYWDDLQKFVRDIEAKLKEKNT